MNKIKIESGEYTEEELLQKIGAAKVWPYEGCKYFYIDEDKYVHQSFWDGFTSEQNIMNTFGIYKEKPSEEEVKMVIRRREILNTWALYPYFNYEEGHLYEAKIEAHNMTDEMQEEFKEVMSYPYTHHTVK